ncbi:MAG: (2Fe-2S)-binding protein [Deltaproteobacteria bacterium]|nr:(2Fe-2S)-binding protein [Deltaproteobacteria bacterium]MBW2120622.1 (2Fe-2S)-binding protein [Deltaproteobacteria bacterium]
MKPIAFHLNGEKVSIAVEPHWTLLQVLRDVLHLTGTHRGCETGDCGACTVILDGLAVNSCLILAVEVEGRSVVTIEGLAREGELDPVQKAFVDRGAIQCGFCTPGMVMASKALLQKNPSPTREEISFRLAGNICRCTGYTKIIEAVIAASKTGNSQK